jgi:hypothetical protein
MTYRRPAREYLSIAAAAMTTQKENNIAARARYILLYPVGTLGPKKAWTTRTQAAAM